MCYKKLKARLFAKKLRHAKDKTFSTIPKCTLSFMHIIQIQFENSNSTKTSLPNSLEK